MPTAPPILTPAVCTGLPHASAREHLNRGDLPQASNKAWGMVAETVKAVSAQHGGMIHNHRTLQIMAAGTDDDDRR